MTTRIKITNVGPENAVVWYYDADRVFKLHRDYLAVGQTIETNVWDGHLPVVLPCGNATKDDGNKFFAVPPAHYHRSGE